MKSAPKRPRQPLRDADEPRNGDGLTVKEQSFVAAIVGPAAGNATQAAKLAGYKATSRGSLKSMASELCSRTRVADAIGEALAKRHASAEWATSRLIDRASASMAFFLDVDEHGIPSLNFAKAAAHGAIGQVKSYDETIVGDPKGQHFVRRVLKLHDPIVALGLLLRMHGLLDGPDPEPQDIVIRVRPRTGGDVRKQLPPFTAPNGAKE